MALVYFGLGSNLGQKENFLRQAISEIEKQIGHVMSQSAFYESEPWGFESPNTFMNACVVAETTLSPHACLSVIKRIEKGLGRVKSSTEGYKDRVIDIDILFYDQIVLQEDPLTIPHPLLHQRLFVLIPLSEIAPDLMHPILKDTIDSIRKKFISSPS